ncbi:AbfB domain-containing protein [Myceligenerans pegani]|uniref:AbfB domain-containing protein n=1 Tax=Myceligenerans pegani TaxID=2776917 RepID=A0ABR9N5U0_9MICO|nr:AbfB domain-containing protein [Myceligenerans sp. TRM 65318]MBE1879027.1 AbfB domain-containing protein [Myceligenerans sp. TRM 65318]MBE3021298.1 AbfB domain-containing protein [Myceligenerans sp. TRM 65318]
MAHSPDTSPLRRVAQSPLTRRTLLGAAAAAPLIAWTASMIPASAVASHPSMLHTAADLSRAAQRVDAGSQPWTGGWNRLVANPRSTTGWNPRPLETVIRGGDGQNYAQLYPDIAAAYQNALRWRISGDGTHGDAAARILNAWSGTLTTVTGNADRFLAAGIYGYQFANAAELVRDHPGFDVTRFRDMLLNVFLPLNEDFLTNHNGAVITNYWANWDLCNMCSILAIGIFADRQDLVDRAIDYFESGAGNGSIENATPFVYANEGLAQWQESGRDQGHTMMGIGLMGTFCEMAWNQGIDCYGYGGNRFLKGCEYVARYNVGLEVPFSEYTWQSGPASSPRWNTQTEISTAARGQARPVWDLVLGHYQGRRGLSAPWSRRIAETLRPDGGGGDYGTTSGGFDHLGFTTLMHAPDTTLRRLQSYNVQDRYARHAGFDMRIDADISPAADALFRVVPGLAGSGTVSFESENYPGRYIRHEDFALKLRANDGSTLFSQDASFRQMAGLANAGWASFQSYNFPDRYIRHANYALRIDPVSTDLSRQDATFRLVA